MAAPKATTPNQSEALDREINALDIRGYTQAEIAAKLGIAQQSVAARLKKLNARAVTDRAERVAQELRTLDTLLTEALDAWERINERPASSLKGLRALMDRPSPFQE